MLVTIDVTQQDISEGKFCSLHKCMVALAINRQLTKNYLAAVGRDGFYIMTFVNREIAAKGLFNNEKVSDSIVMFDSYYPLKKFPEPFSFIIDIPAECLKMEVPTEKVLVT